mmetsp:Transcript_52950/g.121560  ORF Transcript_52950/g.121560 Transcript_52950/m.121560 type:complete len:214 (-) Transcript_52950:400-1041(-)
MWSWPTEALVACGTCGLHLGEHLLQRVQLREDRLLRVQLSCLIRVECLALLLPLLELLDLPGLLLEGFDPLADVCVTERLPLGDLRFDLGLGGNLDALVRIESGAAHLLLLQFLDLPQPLFQILELLLHLRRTPLLSRWLCRRRGGRCSCWRRIAVSHRLDSFVGGRALLARLRVALLCGRRLLSLLLSLSPRRAFLVLQRRLALGRPRHSDN